MESKQRQSNIELCRVISILLVMLVHTTSASLGDNVSFGAQLLEGFSIIGVNVFVLITGYFSTTPKKTAILNIAFICLFWMFIKLMFRFCFEQRIGYTTFFFITSSNWFIPNYIGLLLLTPILNHFSNSISKKVLWYAVIALLIFEIWFDWLPPYPTLTIGAQKGCSVFSFVILYLLSRSIRLHGLPIWFKKYSPIIYVICSIIFACMARGLVLSGREDKVISWLCAYNNPIVIISSVAFLMMFEGITIQSRFINHIAKSTLAVLLGHTAIFFFYTKQFKYLYDHFTGLTVVGLWALAVVVVFVATITVDQLRLILWKPINNWLLTRIKNNNIY